MGNTTKFVSHLFPLLLILSSTKTESVSPKDQSQPSRHFVLVHGACHGAWSWYKLLTPLREAGHNVTALDMTAQGINPVQVKDLQDSISEYFKPLTDFMDSLPSDQRVILVGHSFSGLGISLAMELFAEKISVAVFVAAAMIGPNLNVSTYFQEAYIQEAPMGMRPIIDSHRDGLRDLGSSFVFGPDALKILFYRRSPIEDLALATTLVRPIYLYSLVNLLKELVLTPEKYGSVNRVFIKGDDDFGRIFEDWMINRNPPNEVFEILGSDHMVMMSKPDELLHHLLDIAEDYPDPSIINGQHMSF